MQKQVSTNLYCLHLGHDSETWDLTATKPNIGSWSNMEGEPTVPGTEDNTTRGKYAVLSGLFPQTSRIYFSFSLGQFSGSSKVLSYKGREPSSCTNREANNPRSRSLPGAPPQRATSKAISLSINSTRAIQAKRGVSAAAGSSLSKASIKTKVSTMTEKRYLITYAPAPGKEYSGKLGKAGLMGSTHGSPVIIRVLLPITAFRGDGADNVLSVRTHQLHRMDGQVLVQVCTALSSIGAQVAFVFSFLWGEGTGKNPNGSQK